MLRKLLLVLLPLLILASCNYKLRENPNWDSNFLTPLLKSRVTLKDAIKDTTFIRTNPDNSLTLVYRDTVVNLQLSDYVQVPDTEVQVTVTLQKIKLTTDTLTERLWLADMAREMLTDSDPFNDAIGNTILSQGSGTIPFAPSFSVANGTVVPIDASDYFETADLLTGEIFIKIDNQLPIGLDTVRFTLYNAGPPPMNNLLVDETLTNIPAHTWDTTSADLSGQTMVSSLEGRVERIVTQQVNLPGVQFDTLTDYLEVIVILRNLTASGATAIFPSQTVIDDSTNVRYYFGDGIELTRFVVGSGDLKVTAISTINDTLRFTYELPSALKDGRPVLVVNNMLPAPIGGQIVNDTVFDLSGAYIDLTLNGDSVNLFPQHLTGDLVYSGNMVSMDLDDSIYVYYGLLNIIPSYAEGYLGVDTFDFAESLPFDYFNSVGGGTLDLSRPKVQFTFENSIGVDGELIINSVTAYNRRNGTQVDLSAPIVNAPVAIPGPHLPNVGQTISTKFLLDRNNSNLRDFVNLLPDSMSFDMRVFANKNGVPSLHNNFATDQSRITALMDLEIPLDGIADRILLQDTLDLDLSTATVPEQVIDGELKLYLENSFPFETKVQIYFYNDNFELVDSLFEAGPGLIQAGQVDANGFVSVPTQLMISSFFDRPRLDNLENFGTQAIAKFSLSTQPSGQAVKIYSTYGIGMKLVADFRYKMGM